MNLADELNKLQQLHESGALSDEEFAKAKEAVLSGGAPAQPGGGPSQGFIGNLFAPGNKTLGEAANRFVSVQIVMAVIGVIIFAIFMFVVFLPMWNRAGREQDRNRLQQDEMQKEFERKWNGVFPGK